jgi:hypothetical protein
LGFIWDAKTADNGSVADKEKTVQKTYRLPSADVDMIELLADKQILGSNPSAVVRTIISNALKELIETEYVKKHQDTLERLKAK